MTSNAIMTIAAVGGGGGPQAVGVHSHNTDTDGNVTTAGVVTQATGSTFIIAVACATAGTINTPADNYSGSGNTYSIIGAVQDTGVYKLGVYRCENGAGGVGHTATATATNNAEITVIFLEIKNSAAASYDSGSLGINLDITSPFAVTSGTFAQTNNIVVVAMGTGSGSNPATYAENTGLGFVVQESETNGSVNWTAALATLTITSTSAITPDFTCSGATEMQLKIFGIKA